jgi:hypothetical protein
MPAATRRDKLDKEIAANIGREMEKILKAWREKYPRAYEGARRYDDMFRRYRKAHPEMAEYEAYDAEEDE